MHALKPFEVELIELMLERPDTSDNGHTLDDIVELTPYLENIDTSNHVEYEHTGVGYFQTVSHASIPNRRIVVRPSVFGEIDDILLGFVLFFENGELLVECHTFGDELCPDDVRERGVNILDQR